MFKFVLLLLCHYIIVAIMIPRSVMMKSKKLLIQQQSMTTNNAAVDNNDNREASNIAVNENKVINENEVKKKNKKVVKSPDKLRGVNANVYWRSVPMDDLREHPLYLALPEPYTVNITSSQDLQMFRQDSREWGLLHSGRLTTSKAASCLGFYESKSSEILNIPRSLVGHERILSAHHELKSQLPLSISDLQRMRNEFESFDFGRNNKTIWRAAQNNKFPYTYHPDIRYVKQMKGISRASSARMIWGSTQEATSILSAINYFSRNSKTFQHVKEIGLMPLESVAETCEDNDIYGLGVENSLRVKSYLDLKELPLLGASPDGLIMFDDGQVEILEVKNSSPFISIQSKEMLTVSNSYQFKSLGSWFVPQLMLEILCAGKNCTSAVLIQLSATSGAIVYRIKRDNTYITLMIEWLREFYLNYIVHDKKPLENFMITETTKEKYIDFLKDTKNIAENAEVVAVIPQSDIQRSTINTKFFL